MMPMMAGAKPTRLRPGARARRTSRAPGRLRRPRPPRPARVGATRRRRGGRGRRSRLTDHGSRRCFPGPARRSCPRARAAPAEAVPKGTRSSADFGTHWSTKCASSGPATMTVGIAMRMPKMRVRPRSAFERPIAVTGPGCGAPARAARRGLRAPGCRSSSARSRCAGHEDDDRHEEHDADLEEHGQPDDRRDHRHRPRQPPDRPRRPSRRRSGWRRRSPPAAADIAPSAIRMPTPRRWTRTRRRSLDVARRDRGHRAQHRRAEHEGEERVHLPQLMSTTTARMRSMHAATSCASPAYTVVLCGRQPCRRAGTAQREGRGMASAVLLSVAEGGERTVEHLGALPSLVIVTPARHRRAVRALPAGCAAATAACSDPDDAPSGPG